MEHLTENPYQDILDKKRPLSCRHARMSMTGRGAQFAPFAALAGFEEALQETIRRTEQTYTTQPDEAEQMDHPP